MIKEIIMRLQTFVLSAVFSSVLLGLPVAQANDAKKPATTASQPAKPAVAAKPATPAVTGRINVNTADAGVLTHLKGVGEKKAQAIVAYRKQHGPFNSLEQFEAVPGIGPSIIAQNKSVIVFR